MTKDRTTTALRRESGPGWLASARAYKEPKVSADKGMREGVE